MASIYYFLTINPVIVENVNVGYEELACALPIEIGSLVHGVLNIKG